MAPPGTDKILTHCGVVDANGKIMPAGRKAFVAQVIALLIGGNEDGKGLLLSKALSVPVPPIGGPQFPAISIVHPPVVMEPLFWFGPEPTALLSLPYLSDENGMWSKIFVDGLYATIASALNLNGSYVLPIFDPSIYVDFDFDINVDIPTLAAKIPTIITPDFIIKLNAKLGGSIPIPDLPAIPPTISMPEIPPMPKPPALGFDFGMKLAFPSFFIDFIASIPGLVIPKVPVSLPDIFLGPFNAMLDIFLNLLLKLGVALISPKLLTATMLVIIHNVAVMIACDMIGLILGCGAIVTSVSKFGGLSIGAT